MLKQILAVVAGAGIAVGVFAADAALKDGHPDTYTVRKGDTLWDIAGKFLSKPWRWPEIWQANPQVENPHLIYPGDVLNLVWIDGQRRLVAERPPFGPRVRAEPLSDATTAVPLGRVLPFLEKMRVLDKGEFEGLPYVVGIEENRLRGTPGHVVYVRGIDAAPGARVVLLRATNDYYDVPDTAFWQEERRRVVAHSHDVDGEFYKPTWHWTWTLRFGKTGRSEYLGTELMEVANGEVLRGGDPTTVLVQAADTEVRAGDRVIVGGSMPFDLTFYPRAPKAVPDNLRVISLTEGFAGAGPQQVIALSRGARDGLENGQVFSVYRPGETVVDSVKYPDGSLGRAFRSGRAEVTLPEEFAGHAMVFRTFDRISYALIMDGIRPVEPGDVLREPVN